MSTWLALASATLVAVATITIVGLPVALALRLRGFALAFLCVPAAFAVLAAASVLMPFLGVRWSILPAIALSLALSTLLLLLRRWIKPATAAARPRGSSLAVSLGAAAIGGAAIAFLLVTGFGSGDAISQTFDGAFHLNTVQYMLDSGTASPFQMGLTSPGDPVFYPTLWHAFVTIIAQVTGASIPIATNAALLAVSAVVWPLGALGLARAVAGPSLRVTLIAGALVGAFSNFPFFLAGYGVIYPYILAIALTPYAMVACLLLLGLGPSRRSLEISGFALALLILGSLGAAVLAHPSAFFVVVLWSISPVVWRAVGMYRGRGVQNTDGLINYPIPRGTPRRLAATLALLALTAIVLVAWSTGRTTDNVWQGFFGFRAAALKVLASLPHLPGTAWAMSILIILGVSLTWRHRSMRWVLGSAATLAVFYYISDGFPSSEWRSLLLGPWYNDPRRLAALIPLGAIPLATLGASAAWVMLKPGLQRVSQTFARSPQRATCALTTGALLLLFAIGQASSLGAMTIVKASYTVLAPGKAPQSGHSLLNSDELQLLHRLASEVPAGEIIANNPLNGSSLSYAIAHRKALFPHAGGNYDPRSYKLVDSLVSSPTRACTLARELHVSYVLDFGQDYVLDAKTPRAIPFERMKNLGESPILTKVDHEGTAVLYKITGC